MVISSTKNEEMSSGIDEKEMQRQSRRQKRQTRFSLCIPKISQGLQKFRKDCKNFSTIAKISQGLQKFRNHSENFAILAKFNYAQIFAKLAKFRYHSESYCA